MGRYCMVGMKFRDAVDLVNSLEDGTDLWLEREPDNPHDPNAVKVLYDGLHVAYVKGTEAVGLARKMDADGLEIIAAELIFVDRWPYAQSIDN